jgi:hypothetical protein
LTDVDGNLAAVANASAEHGRMLVFLLKFESAIINASISDKSDRAYRKEA